MSIPLKYSCRCSITFSRSCRLSRSQSFHWRIQNASRRPGRWQMLLKQQQEHVLLLASTDMTHYESRTTATRLDTQAIERMLEFDPQGLYEVVRDKNISMCGMVPTVITMLAAKLLGADAVQLVEYTDSGEASGDTAQVVGYAAWLSHDSQRRRSKRYRIVEFTVKCIWKKLFFNFLSLTISPNQIIIAPLHLAGGWSNGKTADSDSAYRGSNPCPPAIVYSST